MWKYYNYNHRQVHNNAWLNVFEHVIRNIHNLLNTWQHVRDKLIMPQLPFSVELLTSVKYNEWFLLLDSWFGDCMNFRPGGCRRQSVDARRSWADLHQVIGRGRLREERLLLLLDHLLGRRLRWHGHGLGLKAGAAHAQFDGHLDLIHAREDQLL